MGEHEKWMHARDEIKAVRHAAEATLTSLYKTGPNRKQVFASEIGSRHEYKSSVKFTGKDLSNVMLSYDR